MKKMKILITGANGFIGQKACAYFAKRHTVTGLVRKPISSEKKVSGVTYRIGDVRDRDCLLQVTKHVDVIINCAAALSDEKDSYEINVFGTKNLIAAAEKNKVKRIIHISTLSAKLPKKGTYGATKYTADQLLVAAKIPTTILRPSVIYGDTVHGVFGKIVKATQFFLVPVFGTGKTLFYPLFIDDFIEIMNCILTEKTMTSTIYDVGGREQISYGELIRRISSFQGRKVFLIYVSPQIGFFAAKILAQFFYRPPITSSNILGSIQDVTPVFKTFEKEFSVNFRSLDEGLREVFGMTLADEATLLFGYVTQSAPMHIAMPETFVINYQQACINNNVDDPMHPLFFHYPQLLGPADAVSKIFFKRSLLQKKLFVAAAIFETTPASASWLLPPDITAIGILQTGVISGYQFVLKLIAGMICLAAPGFRSAVSNSQ